MKSLIPHSYTTVAFTSAQSMFTLSYINDALKAPSDSSGSVK